MYHPIRRRRICQVIESVLVRGTGVPIAAGRVLVALAQSVSKRVTPQSSVTRKRTPGQVDSHWRGHDKMGVAACLSPPWST